MTAGIDPFVLNIDQHQLDDLKERLARTRWPEKETVNDWSQGAPLAQVQALCEYWQNHNISWTPNPAFAERFHTNRPINGVRNLAGC